MADMNGLSMEVISGVGVWWGDEEGTGTLVLNRPRVDLQILRSPCGKLIAAWEIAGRWVCLAKVGLC
jgi:hypothetical protein